MMITIFGLPMSVKYHDVKLLIKQECKIHDFVLDNLINDGVGSKKVRVGLNDINEGNHLIKCLDGYQMSGNILHVTPVGKSGPMTQSQQGVFETGGFQRPNVQNTNEFGRPVEQRPGPWATNQWTANPVHPQANHNAFQIQQPMQNSIFVPQASHQVRPVFEPHVRGSQPNTPCVGYQNKNLIELGSPRVPQPHIRGDNPDTYHRHMQGGRYPAAQSYEMRQDKTVTIMRDNFQGSNQFNTGSSPQVTDHYQSSVQKPVWSQPHQKPHFTRSIPGSGKIEVDNKKYPQGDRPKLGTDKMVDYKGFKTSNRFSPRRTTEYDRAFSPERRSPHRYGITSGRLSPSERRVSPSTRQAILSGRQMSPSDRRISPPRQPLLSGRQMSPTGRRISPSSRQAIHSGRQMSPGRRDSPSNRQHSGREISPHRRRISPPNRQVILNDRQISPPGRRISPSSRQAMLSGRQMSSTDRRISPSSRQPALAVRQVSPSRRRISPSNRQPVQSVRQMSPSRRRMSPTVRRMSPPVRQISPGRRMSPSGRRISPGRQVAMSRRISPSGRVSPSGRHMVEVPSGRSYPGSRNSPSRKEELVRERIPIQRDLTDHDAGRMYRQLSPNVIRRSSPGRQTMRGSPSRHHVEQNLEKYEEHQDSRGPNPKHVRPAYEINSQASNQAQMYSGGFRPNPLGEKQYPRESPGREQRWQDKDKYSSRNVIDQRREKLGIQNFDIPRASEHQRVAEQDEKKTRDSRSPRRDRSPLRDRFRRHSPSPRSPRRSWALEKRRSPDVHDAPPPPIWPGNDIRNIEYQRQDRPQFSQRDNEKRVPVWERKPEESRGNLPVNDSQRSFESDPIKIKWKPIAQEPPRDPPPRFVQGDRFQSQRDPAYRRKEFGDGYKHVDKDAKVELGRSSFAEHSRHDYEEARNKQGRSDPYKKDVFIGHVADQKDKDLFLKQEELQKEIDDVYKRAVDFAKKAESYRKGDHKRGPNYDEDRRSNDTSGPDYKSQRYDEEPSHSRNQEMRSRRDEKFEPKDTDWNSENIKNSKHSIISAIAKEKRDRAVDEISEKMMSKYGIALPGDIKSIVHEELKLTLSRTLLNMFDGENVSFIEIVVKYNAKYTAKDEEKIFKSIMTKYTSNYRSLKRPAIDDSNIPPKIIRRSPDAKFSKGWNFLQPNVAMTAVSPIGVMINPPVMVPVPSQYQYVQPFPEIPQPVVPETLKKDGYSLYLCKDNFQPFHADESESLKNFLVQQLIVVTETSQGWAPDFTLNKQNSAYRYEVMTRDERSKDWLLSLDFSEYKEFNVLVYTSEELWYERAAIWLPGHSRCRNIEPLTKLKLQNKKLEGVNIGKWKFVKKIVTEKGTRVYVDMPPSSARALEKYKMMLSYELQKVNVFLKAVAVDKDVFDTGLNETSLLFLPNPDTCVMSLISQDPNIVNISLKGNKPLSLSCARKIKDMVIYQLFKYHQLEGTSRTDFIRYGFSQPGYFAVVPENQESKKWICSLNIGKLNRQPVVIVGAENKSTRYIKMIVDLPKGYGGNSVLALERLKHSNQGLKGINFNMWKNGKIITDTNFGKEKLEIEMDLESVESISKIKYQLDYVEEGYGFLTVSVKSEHSRATLEEMISKYKAELNDTYVVANMEISSDSDDDVICYDRWQSRVVHASNTISPFQRKQLEKARFAEQIQISKTRIAQSKLKGTATDNQGALDVVQPRDRLGPVTKVAAKVEIKKPDVPKKVVKGGGSTVNRSAGVTELAVSPNKIPAGSLVVKKDVKNYTKNKVTCSCEDSEKIPPVEVEKQSANDSAKTKVVGSQKTTKAKETPGTKENQNVPNPDESEVPTSGCLELNTVTSRVLQEELQDIMLQTLGLNVTKRLLNVFNPFYIKIKFSKRPESGCLTQFLAEYGIERFKRLAGDTNTFAAQMRDIADFDRICAAKDVSCGSAKLTITPCYKFTKCPPKLKTIFASNCTKKTSEKEAATSDRLKDTDSHVTVSKHLQTNTKKDISPGVKEKDFTNNLKKQIDNSNKKATVINRSEEQQKATTKISVTKVTVSSGNQKVTTAESSKDIQKTSNIVNSIESKKATDKGACKEPITSQESQKATNTVHPKAPQNNTTSPKGLKILTAPTIAPKVTTLGPKKATAPVSKEPEKAMAAVIPKIPQKATNIANLKEQQKTKATVNTKEAPRTTNKAKPKEPQKTTNKASLKAPQKARTTARSKETVKAKNLALLEKNYFDIEENDIVLDECFDDDQLEDDEEMNDEDILALLAQGVVVDECSESEDEI